MMTNVNRWCCISHYSEREFKEAAGTFKTATFLLGGRAVVISGHVVVYLALHLPTVKMGLYEHQTPH